MLPCSLLYLHLQMTSKTQNTQTQGYMDTPWRNCYCIIFRVCLGTMLTLVTLPHKILEIILKTYHHKPVVNPSQTCNSSSTSCITIPIHLHLIFQLCTYLLNSTRLMYNIFAKVNIII